MPQPHNQSSHLRRLHTHDRDLHYPNICSCYDAAYHRSCSGLTRDAAKAALHGGSLFRKRYTAAPPSKPKGFTKPRTEVSEPPSRAIRPKKQLRNILRESQNWLMHQTVGEACGQPVQLDRYIRQMRSKGAHGPKDIPSSFF